MVRTRLKWNVEGEKTSKYFCGLEKYIPSLKVKDENNSEVVVTDQTKVEKEIKKFYGNLYKSHEKEVTINTIESFLENTESCPTIKPNEAEKLGGLITVQEATSYMKGCRSDASPGSIMRAGRGGSCRKSAMFR